MWFRTPASVLLRRAQLTLMLAVLLPTVLITATGIVVLAVGRSSGSIIAGVLVVSFCATALTGYILGTIFVSRGASLSRVQNDFLSAVSHELRTPLTSIQIFIETLRDGRVTDPAERAKCLTLVHAELQRLDELVTKLLALSRLESGRYVFEQKGVPVGDIVDEAIRALQAASLGADVAVEVDVAPDLHVLGDRATLAQSVANLLVNAWKYGTKDGGPITVHAAPWRKRKVEIIVADRGPGIAPEERDRIFERFERGHAAEGHNRGSGLGLAIVRAIVEQHRGRIEIAPSPRGAAFRILLPAARPAESHG